MTPLGRRYWVFDLDGTLTRAVHDFDALRVELGIPRGVGLLEFVTTAAPEVAGPVARRIAEWEEHHAELAEPEPDAVAALVRLVECGARCGVLTRNSHRIARRTLEVAGLSRFFPPEWCIGRDDAAPKPAPDGILRLLGLWGAHPNDGVMVGDFIYDIEAGRAAGVATVLVDRDGAAAEHAAFADFAVRTLTDLV